MEMLQQFIDDLPDGLVVLSGEGVVQAWNRLAVELFGPGLLKARGQALAEYLDDNAGAALERAIHKADQRADFVGSTRDGGRPLWFRLNRAAAGGYRVALSDPASLELYPLTRILGDMWFRREKYRNLRSYLGGIAHDLSNPLTSLLVVVDMIAESISEPDRELLDMLTAEVQRAVKAIKNLSLYATPFRPEKDYFSVNEVLQTCYLLLKPEMRLRRIRLFEDFADLPAFFGDTMLLRQAIMSVMVNALEALGECEGDRRLRLATHSIDSQVIIDIENSGPPVGQEVLDEIFEPWFTTRGAGMMHGLGLAIARAAVQHHDGSLLVQNLEQGVRFRFVLPVLEAPPPEAPLSEDELSGRKVLLFAETRLGKQLAQHLGRHGVDAFSLTDPQAAEESIVARPPDLVVVEVARPKLNGVGFLDRLADTPQLLSRTLLVTADYFDAEVRRVLVASGLPMLIQPFLPSTLWDRLARLMRNVSNSS